MEITVASPRGGQTFVSPDSITMFAGDAVCSEFLELNKNSIWKETTKLDAFLGKADDFDAVFIPGGIGPMYDLVSDSHSQQLIADFHDKGKVVSAVCHGQAALVNVALSNGDRLLTGKHLTAFPESDEVESAHLMPFRLESKLREIEGVRFEIAAEPLGNKVVTDGRLVTGQNPASAYSLADAVLKLIR